MNKKLMTLAVAGAFVAPAAAFAQASNVQIYGTAYIEYGYAKQGVGPAGQLNNVDLLQTPGSAIGFKGEEALGGGLSGWFQCESSMDFRGAGSQPQPAATPTQNSGIFCGRNSALGLKGGFGNIFAGNWDSPWKQYSPQVFGTNETGALGMAPMLYGNSTSTNDGDNGVVFERRQGNSLNYISPNWGGFSGALQISTPQRSLALTSNAPVGKPRQVGVGLNYTNGPLIILGSYESHSNFATLNGATTQKGTTDSGYLLGAAYQFGPVKAGVVYAKRNFDSGCNIATPAVAAVAAVGPFAFNTTTGAITPTVPAVAAVAAGCATGDAAVTTYGLNLDWAIAGPHQLKFGVVRANSTTGTFASAAAVGNLRFNAGAGSTGATQWEVEYIYNFSKRTRVGFGYVNINNDSGASYALSGFTAPAVGQNQSAFMTSLKSTF